MRARNRRENLQDLQQTVLRHLRQIKPEQKNRER